MGAALAPLCLSRMASAQAASVSAGHVIRPPASPMIYTRTLVRELGGGAALTVTRGFAVRFAPHDGGFRIDGRQVSVAVDAPERIAALAKMEEERVEDGLFPLDLDLAGLIVDGTLCSNLEMFDRAVEMASRQIADQRLPRAEAEALQQFVTAIHKASATLSSGLPRTLFAPIPGTTTDRREVALPDGGEGAVETVFEASVDETTGLMREARREVVTMLGDSSRKAVERWSLSPA